MGNTYNQLIEKSQEAFILAIEIYNKPTIRYRVEGFSFFICNAWELMLKAYLIKKDGEDSIYHKDKNDRTINLDNCIKQVFTNENDPLRKNLEKIIELRNTSTHFITEEYEMVYIPLFQACIFNFNEKMYQFHNVDITKLISINFLNLVVTEQNLDENEIRAKYSDKIANKLLENKTKIDSIAENTNSNFAIRIEHDYYLTKDKNKATDTFAIDKESDNKAVIIKELKDPNNTHKFTAKKLYKEVNARLNKNNIELKYKGEKREFNQYHFDLFCKYYDIKNNPRWCYTFRQYRQPQYSYSIQAIDFIVDEIKKNPDGIIEYIKERLALKK